MANAPVTGPPGVSQNTSGYPQYGVEQNAKTGKYSIVTAKNEAQKQTDINAGALVWFTSKAAAQEFIASQGSGTSLLAILSKFLTFPEAIAGWISDRNNIFRILKVMVGGVMILVGLDHVQAISDAAGKAVDLGKVAAL